MKQKPVTIKAAWISGGFIFVAAIIGGLFSIFPKNVLNKQNSIKNIIEAKDSSLVTLTNNRNDVKGDYIENDKIINNYTFDTSNKKSNKKSKNIDNKYYNSNIDKSNRITAPNALIVTSNQSGGNNTVINNYSAKQRKLSEDEKIELINGIDYLIKKNTSNSDCNIIVRAISGYQDSYNFADEIQKLLVNNNYNVQKDIEIYYASPPNKGVQVSFYGNEILINAGLIIE